MNVSPPLSNFLFNPVIEQWIWHSESHFSLPHAATRRTGSQPPCFMQVLCFYTSSFSCPEAGIYEIETTIAGSWQGSPPGIPNIEWVKLDTNLRSSVHNNETGSPLSYDFKVLLYLIVAFWRYDCESFRSANPKLPSFGRWLKTKLHPKMKDLDWFICCCSSLPHLIFLYKPITGTDLSYFIDGSQKRKELK